MPLEQTGKLQSSEGEESRSRPIIVFGERVWDRIAHTVAIHKENARWEYELMLVLIDESYGLCCRGVRV